MEKRGDQFLSGKQLVKDVSHGLFGTLQPNFERFTTCGRDGDHRFSFASLAASCIYCGREMSELVQFDYASTHTKKK